MMDIASRLASPTSSKKTSGQPKSGDILKIEEDVEVWGLVLGPISTSALSIKEKSF